MRRYLLPALAVFLAVPVSARAAERAPLAERLADPAEQERLSATVAVVGEVLLDMPIAPMVSAVTEMAGGDPDRVDRDLTLRKLAPQVGEVPPRAAEALPRVMDAMARMADGFEAMKPALRAAAERAREVAHPPR